MEGNGICMNCSKIGNTTITTVNEIIPEETIPPVSVYVNISPFGFNIIGLCQFSLAFLSTFGNGVAIMIFVKHKQLRSPTNTFIMNLIFCDVLMGMVSFFSAFAALNHGWIFGYNMCVFEGFMVYFLGMASMYLLAAISMDRYIVIAKPLQASNITHRVAILSTGMCWFFGFLWAAFPLFGWNEYALEGLGISCSVIWQTGNIAYTSYIIAIFFTCFLIPVGLMCFAYYYVYMTVRNVTRNNVWDTKSRVARRNLRVEKKMLKTCIAMVAIFVLSWLPYTIVSFVSAFIDATLITPLMATLPALVAKSAGLWNPAIYVATNKQFRYGFYSMVPCKELKGMLVKKEEEQPESSKESDVEDDDKTKQDTKPEPQTAGRAGGNAVAPARDEDDMDAEATVIEDVDIADPGDVQLKEITTK